MPTLTDIIAELENVARAMDENDLPEDERAAFEASATSYMADLREQMADKAEAYIHVIRKLEADQAYLKERSDHYAAKAKSAGNRAGWIKQQLHLAMVSQNLAKVSCPSGSISRRTTTPALILDVSENQVPQRFLRTRVEVDRPAIKDAIKAGESLEWAHLQVGETIHIRG